MSAWTNLLAASSLAIGSAWDLITHPKTGGSGVIVNNGCTIALSTQAVNIALDNASRSVSIADGSMAVTVSDAPIIATLAPGITAQITTTPLGAAI